MDADSGTEKGAAKKKSRSVPHAREAQPGDGTAGLTADGGEAPSGADEAPGPVRHDLEPMPPFGPPAHVPAKLAQLPATPDECEAETKAQTMRKNFGEAPTPDLEDALGKLADTTTSPEVKERVNVLRTKAQTIRLKARSEGISTMTATSLAEFKRDPRAWYLKNNGIDADKIPSNILSDPVLAEAQKVIDAADPETVEGGIALCPADSHRHQSPTRTGCADFSFSEGSLGCATTRDAPR